MSSKSDINLSLPEEKENFILTLEESKQSFPDLTPITETSEDESDNSSMPDLIDDHDPCSSFGCEYKNILQEFTMDYNDEEIENREERYENWKINKQIRFLTLDSPLLKEIQKEKK